MLLQSPAGSTPCCFVPAVTSVLLAVAIPAMRHMLRTQPEKLCGVCDLMIELLKEGAWAKLVLVDNEVGLQLFTLGQTLTVALAPDARVRAPPSQSWSTCGRVGWLLV